MMPAKIRTTVLALVSAATLLGLSGPANAVSYKKLVATGFKTSPLTQAKSGMWGWKVTNGKDAYFCTLDVSLASVGKTGLMSFTTAGRQIKLNRKAYEDTLGGSLGDVPRLEDLKAGRARPADVGNCRPLK